MEQLSLKHGGVNAGVLEVRDDGSRVFVRKTDRPWSYNPETKSSGFLISKGFAVILEMHRLDEIELFDTTMRRNHSIAYRRFRRFRINYPQSVRKGRWWWVSEVHFDGHAKSVVPPVIEKKKFNAIQFTLPLPVTKQIAGAKGKVTLTPAPPPSPRLGQRRTQPVTHKSLI